MPPADLRALAAPNSLPNSKGKRFCAALPKRSTAQAARPWLLGANVEDSLAEISDLDIHPVINSDWQKGMSSSIRSGLAELTNLEPALEAVLFALMDQPLITAEHLAQFVERFQKDRPQIIASAYNGITGVPSLFSRELFDELFKLGGEKGARALIRDRADLATIALEEAAFDVDDISDLEHL